MLTLKHCWIVLLLSHFPIINNKSTCCVSNTLILWFISWISEYELNNNIFPSFFFCCLFKKLWLYMTHQICRLSANFDISWTLFGERRQYSDKIRLNTEIKRMKIMTEEQSKITKSISESMSSERQSGYFCRHLWLTLTRTVSCDQHLLRNRR